MTLLPLLVVLFPKQRIHLLAPAPGRERGFLRGHPVLVEAFYPAALNAHELTRPLYIWFLGFLRIRYEGV